MDFAISPCEIVIEACLHAGSVCDHEESFDVLPIERPKEVRRDWKAIVCFDNQGVTHAWVSAGGRRHCDTASDQLCFTTARRDFEDDAASSKAKASRRRIYISRAAVNTVGRL